MYGFIGAALDSDAGCDSAAAVWPSDASGSGADSAEALGVELAAGVTSGLGSGRGARAACGLDEGSGATFLAVTGSVVKTCPHREHLKVGLSAGRTRSSM